MIAPAPRPGRTASDPREIVAELASILATGYLRVRGARGAPGGVSEKEASASGERGDGKATVLASSASPSVPASTPRGESPTRTESPR